MNPYQPVTVKEENTELRYIVLSNRPPKICFVLGVIAVL